MNTVLASWLEPIIKVATRPSSSLPNAQLTGFGATLPPNNPTTEMKMVLEILEKVRGEYRVDSRRIYVMGMSLGGYGTWDIIRTAPYDFRRSRAHMRWR